MAVQRDNPYSKFNFLVDLGGADPSSVQAGFMEVTGLGMEVSVIEYRNGNEKTNAPRKIPGLIKTRKLHLRRGVIGSTQLFGWLQAVAGGQQAYRDVVIRLQSEDHNVVQSWKLTNALPVRYTGPALSATANEVAIEELVLACETLTLE
jgi:phage tail-like protein